MSKNYQNQLLTISDSQQLVQEQNNTRNYNIADKEYDVHLSLYSQPIFNIYHQIKSLEVIHASDRYSIDISQLNNKGSCFIYLKKNHYESECSSDNKTKRPWS